MAPSPPGTLRARCPGCSPTPMRTRSDCPIRGCRSSTRSSTNATTPSPNVPTPPGPTSRGCSGATRSRCSRSTPTAPAGAFDLLAFNLSAELVYTNVLNMIDLAGAPVRSVERRPEHPLVVIGGHAAFNPEPLADFVDVVVLGEGEEVVGEITEVVHAWKRGRPHRPTAVCCASWRRSPGVYVPSMYDVHLRRPASGERHAAVSRRAGHGRQAHRRRSRRRGRTRSVRWHRSPRWCTTASASRCSAGAPGVAGSARPG